MKIGFGNKTVVFEKMNGFRLKTVRGFESSKKGFESLRLNFKTSGFRQRGFESSKKGFESFKDILATESGFELLKEEFESLRRFFNL